MRDVIFDYPGQIISEFVKHLYVKWSARARDLEFDFVVECVPAGLSEAIASVEITPGDTRGRIIDCAVESLILYDDLFLEVSVDQLVHDSAANASVSAVASYCKICKIKDILILPDDHESDRFRVFIHTKDRRPRVEQVSNQITFILRKSLFGDLLKNFTPTDEK